MEAIFQRRQTIDARLPIEDAWERKRRFLSSYNFDLGIAAVIYGVAIGIAFWVIAASHIGDTIQGLGTELQIIFGTAVFGTFIELLRRTYDTALRRLATIDMFTSEILSIMRVFGSANIIGDFVRLYDRTRSPVVPTSDAVAAASTAGVGFADKPQSSAKGPGIDRAFFSPKTNLCGCLKWVNLDRIGLSERRPLYPTNTLS